MGNHLSTQTNKPSVSQNQSNLSNSTDHATNLKRPRYDPTKDRQYQSTKSEMNRPIHGIKEEIIDDQSMTEKEIWEMIYKPTYKERENAKRFKSKSGSKMVEYCESLTLENCHATACNKIHFRRIIIPNLTDPRLGDCPYLKACHHRNACRYVHYELDNRNTCSYISPDAMMQVDRKRSVGEGQWINCDIREFNMNILGKFGVIMADPPWDIHMNLPYGTMSDDEMRMLNVAPLQSDGLIFLWVTGRAMELGRECLEIWGYEMVQEIIWVKVNQLQRIIRTGRTGHWLNHSKEHCLVGIKGNPKVNRNIDTDVIVSEVRETSRKPDEIYALIERVSPGTRKLELFARKDNTRAGWLSLGNQLDGVKLVDKGLRDRFKAAYPHVQVQPPSSV